MASVDRLTEMLTSDNTFQTTIQKRREGKSGDDRKTISPVGKFTSGTMSKWPAGASLKKLRKGIGACESSPTSYREDGGQEQTQEDAVLRLSGHLRKAGLSVSTPGAKPPSPTPTRRETGQGPGMRAALFRAAARIEASAGSQGGRIESAAVDTGQPSQSSMSCESLQA